MISPDQDRRKSRSQLKSPHTLLRLQHYANFNYDHPDLNGDGELTYADHKMREMNDNRKPVYENMNDKMKSKKFKKQYLKMLSPIY